MLKHLGGAAGGVIGGGLLGLGLLERGGGMYQQYKNLGSIRGGGAAEGFGTEMQMRALALNPFLSTEQARQVIMAGLTEGYSGKQFDTVTEFLANNLKEMNIKVSDSVQMLRKNVNEGGQSIAGLAASMASLKEASKTGALSLPDRARAFQEGTSAMVSSGIGGGAASQAMLEALNVADDDQSLKLTFGQMVANISSNPTGMAMGETFSGVRVPGLNPEVAGMYMSDHGMDMNDFTGKGLMGLYQRVFGNIPHGSKQWYNRLPMFRNLLGQMGMPVDLTQAKQWAEKLAGGGNPADEGKKKQQDIASKVAPRKGLGATGEALGAAATSIMDIGKMAIGGISGLWNGNVGDQAAINAADDMGKAWTNASYDSNSEASNPMIDNIVKQFGAGDIEVGGPDGWSPLSRGGSGSSRAQIEALAKGDLKWRRKGDQGPGMTLAQTPASGDASFRTGGGGQTNVNFSPAQVQIKVNTTTGDATVTPNPVQLTPNQQQVNAGVGGATMNNPQLGDAYGYWPGRSTGAH
jgi:hypothetical protein